MTATKPKNDAGLSGSSETSISQDDKLPFFVVRQNNSGGSFEEPAVSVIIEAENLDQAIQKTSPYFSFCGDSGMYAEYDNCGCCPCCGHRWEHPWDKDPQDRQKLAERVEEAGLNYLGGIATSLIPNGKEIVIGDTEEKLAAILDYIRPTQPKAEAKPI